MRFEVFKDGARVFWTEDEGCVPCEEVQKLLKKGGYKIARTEERKNAHSIENLPGQTSLFN